MIFLSFVDNVTQRLKLGKQIHLVVGGNLNIQSILHLIRLLLLFLLLSEFLVLFLYGAIKVIQGSLLLNVGHILLFRSILGRFFLTLGSEKAGNTVLQARNGVQNHIFLIQLDVHGVLVFLVSFIDDVTWMS